MRLVTLCLASSLVLTCIDGLPAARASVQATGLVLNEIMAGPARDWDGSGTFSARDDEWIELRNAGAAPVDLAGYFLSDADSLPRMALSGTLGPGERLLIFGRQSYDWERANGFPAFGLSLGNSGDAALLWSAAGGETTMVDAYTYRSHEAAADRSVGRVHDGESWQLFDGLNPYTGTTPPPGNHCDPTPGGTNACGGTGTPNVTWGRLKALYR